MNPRVRGGSHAGADAPIPAVAPDPNPPRTAARWRIELLGRVRASCGDVELTRFGSRHIAALLARLALFPRRAHSREELVDLLWPDADLDTGRNRLRQALATLRRLLEPPGLGDVLVADRQQVHLNAAAFSCDVAEFEACVARRDAAGALALYAGELLPGHYDEWILDERSRLAGLADGLTLSAPVAAAAAAASPADVRMEITATQRPDRKELLPAFVARFFGREAQRVALGAWLAEQRLVTLIGAGGTGKTRLAAEVARDVRGRFEVVAFVALAECRDAGELGARVRAAVQLPDSADDALEQICLLLEGRAALLVLDNLEQLVDAGAPAWLETLLQRLPCLRVLATSRRALDIDGERLFDVDPLPLPDPAADLAACAANPSVALFVDRAQGVRPGFALTPGNAPDIAALCRELEGVPLAIELAASRAHALSVADMRAQMSQRFALLARKGARAARASRHASLDAALAWSWQLLDPDEQAGLAALSVFRDGWTSAGAAAVWGQGDAADRLARLAQDSLVRCEAVSDGSLRWTLFEMVREFAAERLDAGRRPGLRARHRAWCRAELQRHAGRLPLADVPNLLQALRSALEDGAPRELIELALAAQSHWERRGVAPDVVALWHEALVQVEARHEDGAAEVHAARRLLARVLFGAGDAQRALDLAEHAVRAAGADAALLAAAQAVLIDMHWMRRDRPGDALVRDVEAALALVGEDAATRAELLNLLGQVHVLGRNDPAAAAPCYEAALAQYEALGDVRRAWTVRLGLGLCAQTERRFDAAYAIHARVAEAARDLDDPLLLTDATNNLAVVSAHARRWHEAVQHCRAQLVLATRQYSRFMQVLALWNLAKPLARCRRAEDAARLMAFSAHAWERHFAPLTGADRHFAARLRRLVEAQLGRPRVAELWAAGERLTLAEAVALALDDAPAGVPASRPKAAGR